MRLISSSISGAGIFFRPKARSYEFPANNATSSRSRESRLLKEDSQTLDTVTKNTQILNGERNIWGAMGRSGETCKDGCVTMPETCCEVRTEVAYPQFGQSAITEETFTIIQDFPDFVQPVFKRVCASTTCNLLVGNCTQKYVPHAVFSAPNGKFGKIFGQDYLLVESGCECTPIYNPPVKPAARSSTYLNNETGKNATRAVAPSRLPLPTIKATASAPETRDCFYRNFT